jgi:regulation of enolase protein 1 (concanavalin A-like superfamily)
VPPRLRLARPSLSLSALACGVFLMSAAAPAGATDQVYFSSSTNVTNILVQYINQETVRLDISSWYLSEHSISIAIANRWAAGVPVRIIGDRAALFENDPHTKAEFYWLANQGIPIRLRFNPTWFPEIDHWKAAIFVGQGLVEFGSGNFAPTELAPVSATNYDDDSEMFTTDPVLVNAFLTKFDVMWNDTTVEPNSIISGPPYLKDWNDACLNEPTGGCADYHTLYPNPAPMTINTQRLEGNNPMPADFYWGQGTDFNNRLTLEIDNEASQVNLAVYRLEVDNITQALLGRYQAGVGVRIIVDPAQYTNNTWPEYWLTHANVDKLYAAGVAIRQRVHQGVTHIKTLITSSYATNASSNFAANWQRDHDYFVSAATKPGVYQAFVNDFQSMWADTTNFAPFTPTPPAAANLLGPGSGATGVPASVTFVWSTAPWATSYDLYLGTTQASMALVANVPAQLVQNPPTSYSWTVSPALQPTTTYFWKVVSRTFATPVNPSMIATSTIQSFTTASAALPLPSPWQNQDVGSTGLAGSASVSAGTFTVQGSGADIWGTSDAFQYAYQPLAGDGQIIARVTSVQSANTYAKAGIMLRETTAAGAAHVILDVRPGGSIEFMTRPSTGAATTYIAGATQPVPAWLQLARRGSTITASVSADGSAWTIVGSTTLSIASNALIGLAVTSHDTTQLNTSTFDTVTVGTSGSTQPPAAPSSPSPTNGASGVAISTALTWSASGATSYDVQFGTANPPPQVTTGQTSASYTPPTLTGGATYFWRIVAHNAAGATTGSVWSFATTGLPSPWQNQDVGSTGLAGTASYSGGTFTTSGSGADIWGSSDAFQYVYQPLGGDGQIVARVTSVQNTNTYAKAGVMLRETTSATAAHVILDVKPDGGIEFMTRPSTGAATTYIAGATQPVPAWLKLVRSGSTVTGSVSADGSTWTVVGSTTLSIASNALIGLVVTSHDTTQLNTSTFDTVAVTP